MKNKIENCFFKKIFFIFYYIKPVTTHMSYDFDDIFVFLFIQYFYENFKLKMFRFEYNTMSLKKYNKFEKIQ